MPGVEIRKFGDMITADLKILSRTESGRQGETVALVIYDLYTHWLNGTLVKTKTLMTPSKL